MKIRPLVLCLTAITSFLVVAAGVRTLVPAPRSEASIKLGYLHRHRDDFDLLFLGNSILYRATIPPVFDARVAEHGLQLRSYNLAAPALSAFERDLVLESILAGRPRRLRYVLLQPLDYHPKVPRGQAFTKRTVDWHTLSNSIDSIRSSLRLRAPRLAWEHAVYFCRHLTGYGRGSDILAGLLGQEPDGHTQLVARTVSEGGYLPLEEEPAPPWNRRRELLENLPEFARRVAALRDRRSDRYPPPVDRRRTERLLERLETAGIQPVFIVAPGNWWTARHPTRAEGGVLPNLLELNDPDRFPELFREELFWDFAHLNRRGAERFSRALADEFATRIATVGGESRPVGGRDDALH